MDKRCAVVFPTQKDSLCGDELISLKRVVQILGERRDIYVLTKKTVQDSFYIGVSNKIKVIHVPDEFMTSYQNYSRMCMSKQFYELFKGYDYILIAQPDVYTFRDNIDYFISLGYDYYGAPLVNCESWGTRDEIVGCGGLSLRKVSKFLEISRPFNEIQYVPEDLYFCTNKKINLNKCPVDVALKLCFSADTKDIYEYWYQRTNGTLPDFVHIFKKNDTWNFWRKYIEREEKMKIHFITFANSESNFSFERIRYEAEQMKCFETITTYTEKDFDEQYWNKNKEHFNGTRGYGYWSWKPYFINKKFSEIGENEIVVYADTGCMLLDKNRDRLIQWCLRARNSQSGILSPCFGPYIEHDWSKGDIYKYINDNYNKENVDIFDKAVQCGAGILCVSKNKKSIEFMNIWNDIMENHFDFITDSPSKYPNHPNFHENRHDQSVFSMISKIFKIETVETRNGILDKENSPIICSRIKNDKNTWKKPIRVLYDHQIFDLQKFGGISKVITEIIKETDKNEIVENFTGNGIANGKYQSVKSTIGVLNTNNENLLQFGFNNEQINKTNREYTIELLKNGEFDVFIPTFYDTYFLDHLNGKPFVLFIPDMITELYPQYFPQNDMQNVGKRILAPLASHIMVPTQNTKNDVMRILGIPEENITVISHGISKNYGNRTFEKSILDSPYILYVGHRNAYKRFDLFLRYARPFLENHKDYKILFTGPKFTQIELDYMRNLGLSGRLAYYHPKNDDEMASLYKYAKCFVYSSEYEGFGIPILEAYKMRCPVLLNNRSCFPEVAGSAATYFEMTEEFSNLSEKLEYICNLNQDEIESMMNNQDLRLAKYSWRKTSDIVQKVFNGVI